MKPIKNLRPRCPASVLALLAGLGAATGVTGGLAAESGDFDTQITIAEIMDSIVMREADVIWQSVQYASTEDGYKMIGPETDEDWLAVRYAALTLAEVSNNLVIPGRHANKPDAESGEGELTPAQIDALIEKQRPAWIAYARALRAAAMQTVAYVDARDLDGILDVGGTIDEACESCHVTFWYPNQ